MARPKNAKTPLQDLYTETTLELMYLRRAWRTLKEHHPDFRNLPLVEDRSEEAFAEFVGKVKHIAEEARRRGCGGVQNNLSDIMPQYIGTGIEAIFNPVTMFNPTEEE